MMPLNMEYATNEAQPLTEIGWRLSFFVPFLVIAGLALIAFLIWAIPFGLEKIAKWRFNRKPDETSDHFDSPWRYRHGFSSWDREPSYFMSSIAVIFALLIGAIQAFCLIPYSTEYWKLYRVSGEVVNVSNVFTEASGELSQEPVIQLDTVDRPISIDDPRAIYLDGEDVTLTCTVNWRYQAADRYSCEIYEIGAQP